MGLIQEEITNGLVRASAGYARIGLALAFGLPGFGRHPQVALGNLAIAIELLFKAVIAKRSLLLLFKDLPIDLRCALAASGAMPKSFRTAPFEIELKASAYKSVELDEAIATFYVFFPEAKTRFVSYLRLLSRHRNVSVHAVHPDFRDCEVDRTAFLFLSLVEYLRKEDPKLIQRVSFGNDEKNKLFLAKFDEARGACVHEKIEKAQKAARKIKEKVSFESTEWDWLPITCPVCGSDGILSGETSAEPDFDEDYVLCGFTLSFIGETFKCDQCGLALGDYDEMMLAGIDPEVDRSDESDRWQEEQADADENEPWYP